MTLSTASTFIDLATALRVGAAADIWYDAASHSDEAADGAIDQAKAAMETAAEIISDSITIAGPHMFAALQLAETFMAGFEGDEMQDGIDSKLATIRAAIAQAGGQVDAAPVTSMFLVSGDSGDLDVSAFVEATDRQHALDMHAEYIQAEYQVCGNELDCPRNVWVVPATRGTAGVLGWRIDVTLCEGVDGFYREGDETDENPFHPESPEGRAFERGEE